MVKTIALIATLDTKGAEAKYVKEQIEAGGKRAILIDSGILGEPLAIVPDISRQEVAQAAGRSLEQAREAGSRGAAVEIMMGGIINIVTNLYATGQIHGVLSVGGAEGTFLGTAGMKALPIGVPKVMVTPVAAGLERFGPYTGTKDVMLIHSVVDILGINPISQKVFDNAVAAVLGMVDAEVGVEITARNLIGVTMLGNTTPAIMHAKELLEAAGYQLLVFHANGAGGRAMDELIEQGVFIAVLDYTPHELTDELVGAWYRAGPQRMDAASKTGTPQVVVPGAIDIIVEGPREQLPAKYEGRPLYYHNPTITLSRTNKEEAGILGETIAAKLNMAKGPAAIVVPLRGMSLSNREGQVFWDPEADGFFLERLKANLNPKVELIEVDAHVNDAAFVKDVVRTLLQIIEKARSSKYRSGS